MICEITFNNESGCIKPITGYEVSVYALNTINQEPGGSDLDTLLATFESAILDVPFNLVNETASDVSAAFSGTFKSDVILDTTLLPEDILFCYRVLSDCGDSEWCCMRLIAEIEEEMFLQMAMNESIDDIS